VYVDNLVSAAGQVMRACVLMLLMLAQLTLKCTAAAADDKYRCKTATKRSFLLVIIFTWSSSSPSSSSSFCQFKACRFKHLVKRKNKTV